MIKYVWLLPLFTFLIVPCSFFISYGIAVEYNHTDSFWPFISCILGQLLNIGALLLGLCVYLRHRQVVQFYGHDLASSGRIWRVVSTVFLVIGFISAFGMSMVANFQETRMKHVHIISALMSFGGGIVYGWGQTIFSYTMKPRMAHLNLAHIRLVLSTLGTGFFISMMSMGFVGPHVKYKFHWKSTDPGYPEHIVATLSEWAMVFSFMLFILSFAWEMRDTHIPAEYGGEYSASTTYGRYTVTLPPSDPSY